MGQNGIYSAVILNLILPFLFNVRGLVLLFMFCNYQKKVTFRRETGKSHGRKSKLWQKKEKQIKTVERRKIRRKANTQYRKVKKKK